MATFTPYEKIMKGRMALCLDSPFFGVQMMRLKLREVKAGEMPCDTMATDGVSLLYYAPYVEPLTGPQMIGLLAHEVMHNALLHHTRRNKRDPKQWNIACDAAIDHMLKDAGFDVPDSFAEMAAWDWAKGLSAEMIYNDPRSKPKSGGAGGDGPPRPGSVMDLPADQNPLQAEADIKIGLKQAVMTQANYDRRKGKDSAWIKSFVDEVCEPKIRWQDELRRFYAPMSPSDYSWARPSRRYLSQGLYLPGVVKTGVGEGIVFFDSSGSCISDWPQFRGELDAIFGEVKPERVHVIMCDSSVKNVTTYEMDEEFNPEVTGHGGSDFRPAFKLVEEMQIRPQWAVVLSDMEINFPVEPPPYPVIAVSTTNHPGPDWAHNVRMEP